MNNIKYQNYLHYKLPITINPLEYGKLIEQIGDKYVIQLITKNIAVIKQINNENFVRIFRNGDLILEFSDKILSEKSLIRTINDTKFTFENDKLISTQILNAFLTKNSVITPLNFLKNKQTELFILFELTLIWLICFIIFPEELETSIAMIVLSSNLKNKLNWIDFNLEIKNTNFSSKLLKTKLDIFWKEIVENKLSENQHIWLLFRLNWANGEYVTIGNLIKLNKEDKNYLFDFILRNMDDKSEYYTEQLIKSMIFSYTIKSGKAKEKITFDSSNISYQYYQHHKLPITMDPLKYGKLIEQTDNKFTVQVNKTDIAIITKDGLNNNIKYYKEGNLTYQYKDLKLSSNKFIRVLKNKNFIFIDNKLVLFSVDKRVKFIKRLLPQSKSINKVITMDIETFIKNGVHIPYCISWYDGEKSRSYYILDSKSSDDMIIQSIKDLMIKKYDNYNVYIHNLSRFDGIFLLKILANLGQIKPIIHNDKLIYIGFKFNNYNITFKDSQQILLLSLRKLGRAFEVDILKSFFPYDFVNENNLDYIGITPDFSLFNDISHDEYDGIISNNWNLKNEAINYCEKDCISLYQIIIKFSNMIYELFKINIHKYPTLSSLAFGIFRTHFLKNDVIPQLSGKIAKDIREGYTGGAVDVYIPENPEGTKVYVYDVNSLYPSTMLDCLMPTGKPIHFSSGAKKIIIDIGTKVGTAVITGAVAGATKSIVYKQLSDDKDDDKDKNNDSKDKGDSDNKQGSSDNSK